MAKNFISNKDESARMFRNGFLESLSKVHFTVPLFIYVPLIGFLLFEALFSLRIAVPSIAACFLLGIACWTFVEYVLHRFLFHYQPPGKIGERIHFIFHGVHHDYPNDSKRLVLPPSVSVPLALLFYKIFQLVLGKIMVFPLFAGFVTGYLFYDITHYALHHFNFKSPFWLKLKHHHMLHHYQESTKGYGVSSAFWDKVFFTTFTRKKNG